MSLQGIRMEDFAPARSSQLKRPNVHCLPLGVLQIVSATEHSQRMAFRHLIVARICDMGDRTLFAVVIREQNVTEHLL